MTEVVEAPGAESAQELKRITHWINGTSVAGEPGRSGPVYNPAAGIQTSEVDFASAEEVDRAVQAAKEAFASWRAVSLSRKTEIFFRIRALVDAHREDIAKILTAEHGKVLSDAKGEVARGLEVIEFCCGIPELLKGGFTEQASTGIDVYSIRQPLGVCAGITPFNFPTMVPMWMWAPALASAIKERLPKVKVGDGMSPDAEMGPLVTREHRDKVASYIDKGREAGATVVTDGRENAPDGGGFFLGVTLLDDVKPEMDVYKDEILGPVLGVTRVDTYDEAVRLANANPYGIGEAVFTRHRGAARQS